MFSKIHCRMCGHRKERNCFSANGRRASTCNTCEIGVNNPLSYECDRCHCIQQIPHPMYRYQPAPDQFGTATWACHRRCCAQTHWRVVPYDLLRVPSDDVPASWPEGWNMVNIPVPSGNVVFTAANHYGLSARKSSRKPMNEGDQLINEAAHRDVFKIECLGENIITIESMAVPGLYIGLGEELRENFAGRVFKAVLVNPAVDGESHKLRVVPAKDGSRDPYVSFEPVSKSGYVLNHSCGKMFFSNAPVYNNAAYKQDSSWRMTKVETVEEMAMKLPTIRVEKSRLVNEECPCCLEPYNSKRIQVMTECNHHFCMRCVISVARMDMSDENAGSCPMCRRHVKVSNLKRVCVLETEDIS